MLGWGTESSFSFQFAAVQPDLSPNEWTTFVASVNAWAEGRLTDERAQRWRALKREQVDLQALLKTALTRIVSQHQMAADRCSQDC